jgi:hypothetical protein
VSSGSSGRVEERPGPLLLRVVDDLLRRPFLNDPAGVDEADPV